MPTPKPALTPSTPPKTPRILGGNEKDELERAIRCKISERAYHLFEVAGRESRELVGNQRNSAGRFGRVDRSHA